MEKKEEAKPSPPKKRRYSKVNYPIRRFSHPDLPWVIPEQYPPCPHIHLKAWTIDRDVLTTAEQLNLLATPKGYRWYSKSDTLTKRLVNKEPGKKRLKRKKPFPGLRQFMAEIWCLLSPEMVVRLKEILEEELHMSGEEAMEFLARERVRALRLAEEELTGPAGRLTREDIAWARSMAGELAGKAAGAGELLASGRRARSKRTRLLRERLVSDLHGFCGLEDNGPSTPIRKALYTAGQLLALWLACLPSESGILNACKDFEEVYSDVNLI